MKQIIGYILTIILVVCSLPFTLIMLIWKMAHEVSDQLLYGVVDLTDGKE